MHYKLLQCHTCLTVSGNGQPDPQPAWSVRCDTPPPPSGDGPGYPLPCLGVIEPPPRVCSKEGASWGEGTPKGAPPPGSPGSGTQRTRRLMFHERFWWHTHNVRAIQADRILAEKRRRGWFSDYPEARSNMYLLAPDQVYKVRLLASSVWVPEVRRWEPEVFIIGEGINFTVEDTTRLLQNLRKANMIAEQVGIRLYKEQKLEAMREVDKPHPRVTKGRGSALSQSSDGVKVTGCNLFSAVPSTKARPGTHHSMA